MPAPTTITKFTVANITDGMSALYGHFNGTSTLWALDSGVSDQSTNGIVIKQGGASGVNTGVGQLSMRRTGTTSFILMMDPTSSITVAGKTSAPPAGANASQSSPELTYAVSTSTTASLCLLEWPEEIAIIVKTASNTHTYAFVMGRALAQDWEDAPGRYVGDVLTTTSRVQVWDGGSQAQNWVTVATMAVASVNSGATYVNNTTLGGLYMPQAEKVGVITNNREAGRMLNWSRQFPSQSPTYRSTNGTREIVHIGAATTQLVVNWKPGVTP